MLACLDNSPSHTPFPPLSRCRDDLGGIIAIGGDLHPQRLLNAYRHGIFPWYGEDEDIMWWSPNPRMVLFPQNFKLQRSLAKSLRNKDFEFRHDTAFDEVIRACAAPRLKQKSTWIVEDMINAYSLLHRMGYAHSIECWQRGDLVGGLYGIQLEDCFFGESMFSRVTDSSKASLYHLCQIQPFGALKLIDAQVSSPHLESLGAENISRDHFVKLIRHLANS